MKSIFKPKFKLLRIVILSLTLFSNSVFSQSTCDPEVPSFTVNLAGRPSGYWASPDTSRKGQCCGVSNNDRCVYFNLTLDPNAAGIQIDMIGADPKGALSYSFSCAPPGYPGGAIKCISGVGPHHITFCKEGNNANIYKITSISKPLFPKDTIVRKGCSVQLITEGIVSSSTRWRAINTSAGSDPSLLSDCNAYLTATNVASPTYSPAMDAPDWVAYEICGFPMASACGYSLETCGTITVTNVGAISASVSPNPASFCYVGPGSGVVLTGSVNAGGLAPYSYIWRNDLGTQLATGSVYTATAAANYKFEIRDKLYNPTSCPSTIIDPVKVTVGLIPTVTCGSSQTVCASSPTAVVTGTVLGSSGIGGIWSGGMGTYNPGNSFTNQNQIQTSYIPHQDEIDAGFVKLYLTSQNEGGNCTSKKDSTYIYYSSAPSVTLTAGALACHNSTAVITASVSGGTPPYRYVWNNIQDNSASGNSIVATEGVYSVLVYDFIGCSSINTSTSVSAPDQLGLDFTSIDVNVGADGVATASVTGGTSTYSVVWNPGGATTFTINGLTYGVYSATVTDANGCKISGSTVVSNTLCAGFSSTISATNVLCYGQSNATATVTASGGTFPAYTYTWNTVPEQYTNVVSGLKAGVYTAISEDGAGCLHAENITIHEPAPLTTILTHTDVTIENGNNGSATVNAFGGIGSYDYLWTPNTVTGYTTSTISNLYAGTYTVTVNDDNNCTRTDSVKITQPPCNSLVLNIYSNNSLCNGGKGSAFATVAGATGSYTVSWANILTGSVGTGLAVSNLSPGNYSVMVRDNKCSEFVNFSITQPTELSIGLAPTNISCHGLQVPDGAIELTVSGGTFPYSFSWNNGAYTSEDLVNLAAGAYGIVVTDKNGCSAKSSAVITEPAKLTLSATAKDVTCYGGQNGAITTTVTGGYTPYTYLWSNSSPAANQYSLTAGGYTLSVRDANNCIVDRDTILAIGQPDSLMVDSFAVSCSVPGTGKTLVEIIPTGGYTGVFLVSLNNGSYQAIGDSTFLLNNNTTYTVNLKDANNCISRIPDIITLGDEVKVNAITFNKCYAPGTATAQVTVSASGGDNGPYSISYDNGGSYLASGTYSNNLSVASSYTVIAKDSKGCVSASTVITLPAVFNTTTTITSNYNGKDISCFGLTNGSASVTVNGGTAPYTYSWTSAGTNTLSSVTNLGAGTYSVTVKDQNNCSASNTITLTAPVAVTATAVVSSNYNGKDISCFGALDGAATVNTSGGTTPYSYVWIPTASQTNSVAIGLGAGTYSVLVKDANNCSVTKTVTLTQPTAIASTETVISNFNGSQVSCFGATNASITSVASGATAPYSYTWTSPATTNSLLTNVGAGTYTVIVKDVNSCAITKTVSVSNPPAIAATTSITSNYNGQNISCFNLTDGSALVIPSGGTGAYTFSWTSSPIQTTSVVTNIGQGTYSVIVTDVNGCNVTKNVTLIEPSQVTSTVAVTSSHNGRDISCFGLTDGSAAVQVSGGTPGYTYSWTTASTNTLSNVNNIGAGTYTVTIKDINNCTITNTVTLNEPAAVSATAVVSSNYNGKDISCFGYTDGEATVTANGGTTPYSYAWTPSASQTNSVAIGLGAGTYSVLVKDVNNCSITKTVTLTQPAGVVSTETVISNFNGRQVSCFAATDATITSIATNGTGPYTYTWTSPATTGTVLPNVGAGVYTVNISDVNSCVITKTITVSQPDLVVATTSITSNYNGQNISCFGLTDGSAIVNANGGTTPYSYVWTDASAQSTSTLSNVGQGTYSVTVTDINGCNVTKEITLVEPTQVTSTIAVTSSHNGRDISCFGLTDGSAAVEVIGGTPGYTYSWTTASTNTLSNVSNIGAGTYTVTIKDKNNCTIINTVTLTEPALVTATAVVTSNYNGQNISCFEYRDGEATVTANGGTTPYSYSWNSVPTQTNAIATGLAAGDYSVVVRDINNCLITTTVTLTQPSAVVSTETVISNFNGRQVSCFAATDATITSVATDGTGPYTYTWANPAATGTVLANVGAGVYTVSVADVNSCIVTKTISVSEPEPLVASTSVISNYNGQNISCYGLTDATANVTANGGTIPYTYNWSATPTQTNAVLANVGAGTYSVLVTDINGCNIIRTISISEPTEITAQVLSVSNYNGYNVTCYGSSNGNIDITVNGGTGVYTYTWSNSSITQDITNLTAGNYSVIVADVNNCKDTVITNLTEPNALVAIIDSVTNYNGYNVSCNGLQDGNVFVTTTGGVANYTYTWSNNTSNEDLTNVGIGTYNLLVTDKNLCTVSVDTMLTQPSKLVGAYATLSPLCYGLSTGAIDFAITGGVTPYGYSWSNGSITEDLANVAAGTYTLNYHDLNGCSGSIIAEVTQPDTILVNKIVSNIKCYGDTVGRISLSPMGGTAPYSYVWSDGTTTKDLINIPSGVYTATVTDSQGCVYNDTTEITQPDSLYISLSSPTLFNGHNVSQYQGSDGAIELVVTGGVSPYNYLWSNGESNEDLYNITAGNYIVAVTDANGCKVSGSIQVTEPLVLEMPQGFSPNGDDKNELFVVHGIEAYPDNVLTIYNRWGNIVYSKTGYLNEWDGVSNSGEALPDATYFAILEVNKGKIVLKGYVELRR